MEFIAAKLGWIDRATPKVYLARISRTNGTAITCLSKVYKNTLSNSATWATGASATYTLKFIQNVMPSATKTHIDVRFTPKATTATSTTMHHFRVNASRFNASTVYLKTYSNAVNAASVAMLGTRTVELEIKVYK